MMKRALLAGLSLALAAGVAQAQEVKVGLVLPYTGVGAELAQPIDRGVELYLKTHADEIKPYKHQADQARLRRTPAARPPRSWCRNC